MITVFVQFSLSHKMSPEQAKAIFLAVSSKFYEVPGLIRKYFLLSEDGKTAGGVYLWSSRQAANRFYTEQFKRSIRQQYGSEPSITYFESPVIVENMPSIESSV